MSIVTSIVNINANTTLSKIYWVVGIVIGIALLILITKGEIDMRKAENKVRKKINKPSVNNYIYSIGEETERKNGKLLKKIRYATVRNGNGKELYRHYETDKQTIEQFIEEDGVFYMHTTEIKEDGSAVSAKWVFSPEQHEFVKCE